MIHSPERPTERVGGVSWGRGRFCLPWWMGSQDTPFLLTERLSFVISLLQLEVQGEVIPLNSKLAEDDADVLKGCISANSCLFYSWKLTYVHILDEVLEDQIRSNRTQSVTQDKLSQEARDDLSPRTVATWDSDVKEASLQVSCNSYMSKYTAPPSTSGQHLPVWRWLWTSSYSFGMMAPVLPHSWWNKCSCWLEKWWLYFILFLEKKSLSTGCQGQLECVGRGTLFFSWLL